jgi:DNA invertase Pin-like site-specific DNA recombinase
MFGETTMSKSAVIYARVSSEEQAKGEAVSIDGQLFDCLALVARNGWQVSGQYIDCEDYKATQDPKRGRMANPSGERADRPEFLKLLEQDKAGEADIILGWRDDRLVRHPRAAAALTDAIDAGNVKHKGGKIGIYDATAPRLTNSD